MIVILYVAKCSYPVVGLGVLVMEYSDPALEGASVTFGCSPGLVLMGTNTSTCMENGQWTPDPGNMSCEGA